ncbi:MULTISPECIES: DUF3040 domain-containing protein [unclassified Corynebacterium]|uniref:DUF3040 domain-containing protein n=1 Tax=unclassified Corynebacterium TaxID=2624378 RepID=UPI0029C9F18C|nr:MULTISPECIES: DUF3040 domain-containing protein [unclassified Corynebacterium]WPF65450.1 DUF3040 domain-containing protein [Corynebacterium sp. 22KM0430]WPF67946.1 DUF3040 domain-containing protein [Corynebacterium sp. 21KM1197]
MSLSEQEQRALREIEQSLLAEDPTFGSSVTGARGVVGAAPGRVFRGIALGVLGLVMLIGGVALAQNSLWFIALSVAGFLLMFGAGVWALRGSGDAVISSGRAAGGRAGVQGKPAGGSTMASRMEEDFRRRFE